MIHLHRRRIEKPPDIPSAPTSAPIRYRTGAANDPRSSPRASPSSSANGRRGHGFRGKTSHAGAVLCYQGMFRLLVGAILSTLLILVSRLYITGHEHSIDRLSSSGLRKLLHVPTKPRARSSPPRIVRYAQDGMISAVHSLPLIIYNDTTEYRVPELNQTAPQCVPMAQWQTRSFPNCNTHHEIDCPSRMEDPSGRHYDAHAPTNSTRHDDDDLSRSTPKLWRDKRIKRTPSRALSQETLHVLGEGWFRTTWSLDHVAFNDDGQLAVDELVLKMLRIERDFTDEFYELHRRDATALERLTSSHFVVNVHGYCGQSTINERANFQVDGLKSLEDFDRRMRGLNTPYANALKLRVAASVATAVADVHRVPLHENGMEGEVPRVSMVHYDVNPRNVALFKGGRPKLNDFNIALFLQVNPATNETCGFPSRMHEPWWRAPEEMDVNSTVPVLLDEKVDVYALGNLLHHILTSYAPRGKMKRERMELVRSIVAKGIPPTLPEPYASDSNPVFVAFRKAMALCFVANPKERGTAADVADILLDALVKLGNKEAPALPDLAHRNVEKSEEGSSDDGDNAE
jgi:Protein kinase domain